MEGPRLPRHLDQTVHLRRQLGSWSLVDLVAMSGSQGLGITGDQTGGEGGHPGQTAPNHRMGMDRSDDPPSVVGGKARSRDRHHHPQRRVDRQSDRQPLGRDQDQPSIDRGSDIVGMTFELGSDAKDMVGVGFVPHCPEGGGGSGHVGSCRRAKALPDGDTGVHLQRKWAVITYDPACCAEDGVTLSRGGSELPDVVNSPDVRETSADLASHLERQTETVEGGPEIG